MDYDSFDETTPTWDATQETWDNGLPPLTFPKRNIRSSGRSKTRGHNWAAHNQQHSEDEIDEEF